MKKTLCLTLILALLVAATPVRADSGPPAEPGRHRWLGLTLGLVSGVLLGSYAAYSITDDDGSAGTFFALWTAFAAGGALAGYAAGGGFKDPGGVALDRLREELREREARAPHAGPEPLAGLRLSAIPGLEDLDALKGLDGPVRQPELRLAAAAGQP